VLNITVKYCHILILFLSQAKASVSNAICCGLDYATCYSLGNTLKDFEEEKLISSVTAKFRHCFPINAYVLVFFVFNYLV
jgi:hypothetical protein